MPKISKHLITAICLLIGISIPINSAYALYSPRLSRQVAQIKQHVEESKAQTGGGTLLEEIEQIKAYDKAREQISQETGYAKETGIAGEAQIARDLISNTLNVVESLDALMMVFNYNYVNGEFISNCLRDDIWSLEALRDLVGNEMLKAYMLRDAYHGDLLAQDYQYLTTHIDLLRLYGSDPTTTFKALLNNQTVDVTSSKYFFGKEASGSPPLNYYSNPGIFSSSEGSGCPDGEFEEAFEQVVNSWKTLNGTVGGHSLFSAEKWGSIMAMAQANARARAKEWIRANQMTLTIGGEEGGGIESLVKGGGLDKFKGKWATQYEILKNMTVGPVTPLFDSDKYEATVLSSDCVFYDQDSDVFRDCEDDQIDDYEACQEDKEAAENGPDKIRCDRFRSRNEYTSVVDYTARQRALEQDHEQKTDEIENTFMFSITLDSVAEQNLYFLDDIMFDMNSNIQRGYEKYEDAGKGIPSLTKKIEKLSDKQCANQ